MDLNSRLLIAMEVFSVRMRIHENAPDHANQPIQVEPVGGAASRHR